MDAMEMGPRSRRADFDDLFTAQFAHVAHTVFLILRDRARSVDGTLTITSPAGGPTVLRVELPCES